MAAFALWPGLGATFGACASAASDDASDADAAASPSCIKAADCPAPDGPCQAAACVAGACVLFTHEGGCEDGDPCTLGDACKAGGCVAGADVCECATAADCPSVDLCAGVAVCDSSSFPRRCKVDAGAAPVCKGDTGSACSREVCVAAKGGCAVVPTSEAWLDCTPAGCTWRAAPAGLPATLVPLACDDGDLCTSGDACVGATCTPGADACACKADADCTDDGDLCNGKPDCDKAALPWTCKVNPATKVSCDAAADTACSKSVCDAKTGACAAAPIEATAKVCSGATCTFVPATPDPKAPPTPCDDGDVCTAGDVCKAGMCKASADVCKFGSDADCAGKEDGDACNGTLYCDLQKGSCELNPATVIHCQTVDDTACSKHVCYPKTGLCAPAPVELSALVCTGKICAYALKKPGGASKPTPCDDGNACTAGEACALGACSGGVDTCACSKDADCAKLDDGDVCNGVPYCDKAKQSCVANPKSVVVCQSVGDTACAKNACDPKSGACAPTPVGKTVEVCAEIGGKPQCVLEVSAEAEALGVGCQDGDPCTKSDVCLGGSCVSGANTCACSADKDCLGQDDGNVCNGMMFCDKAKGICKHNPATVITCPTVADTACLKNACHPSPGACQAVVIAKAQAVCAGGDCHFEVRLGAESTVTVACEDGAPCTKGDACGGGVCKPGVFTCECDGNADCAAKDDGNLCNGVPFCDKSDLAAPKCKDNPASAVLCPPSQSFCAQNACDPALGACALVAAHQGKSCDDGTLCTEADACDGKTGACVHDALALNAKACSDSDPCTLGDVCQAGSCSAGPPPLCPAPKEACQQAQCVPQGAASYQCVTVLASDGTPCAGGGGCTLDAACSKGACVPGKTGRLGVGTDPEHKVGYLRWTAVEPAPGGGGFVAGYVWSGPIVTNVKYGKLWLGKFDDAGVVLWRVTLATDFAPTMPDTNQLALKATDDGGVLLAATLAAPPGAPEQKAKPMIAAFDASGAMQSKKLYGDPALDESYTAAHLQPGGTSWLVGSRFPGIPSNHALVINVAPNGQQVFAKTYPALGTNVKLHVVLGRKGGDVWLVGHRSASLVQEGLIVGLDAKGGEQFVRALPPALFSSHPSMLLTEAAARADGAVVLAGSMKYLGMYYPFRALVRDDATLWAFEVGASNGRIFALGAAPGDHFVAAGDAQPIGASSHTAGADGLDRWINAPWSAQTPDVTAWYGAAAHGKGGWWLVGAKVVVNGPNPGSFPRLGRLDGWGRASCAAAGACASLASKACDDGSDCTADGCSPAKGCTSVAVAQLRCRADDSCSSIGLCQDGGCPQTEDGRLWAAKLQDNATVYAVATLADGRALWTGTISVNGAPQVVVGRSDRYGNAELGMTYSVNKAGTAQQYAFGHDILATADGGLLVAATGRENDKHLEGCTNCLKRWRNLRRWSGAGQLQWEIFPDGDAAQESDDLHRLSDGTFGWLWRDAEGAQATRLNDAGGIIWEVGPYAPPSQPATPALEKKVFGLRGLAMSSTYGGPLASCSTPAAPRSSSPTSRCRRSPAAMCPSTSRRPPTTACTSPCTSSMAAAMSPRSRGWTPTMCCRSCTASTTTSRTPAGRCTIQATSCCWPASASKPAPTPSGSSAAPSQVSASPAPCCRAPGRFLASLGSKAATCWSVAAPNRVASAPARCGASTPSASRAAAPPAPALARRRRTATTATAAPWMPATRSRAAFTPAAVRVADREDWPRLSWLGVAPRRVHAGLRRPKAKDRGATPWIEEPTHEPPSTRHRQRAAQRLSVLHRVAGPPLRDRRGGHRLLRQLLELPRRRPHGLLVAPRPRPAGRRPRGRHHCPPAARRRGWAAPALPSPGALQGQPHRPCPRRSHRPQQLHFPHVDHRQAPPADGGDR